MRSPALGDFTVRAPAEQDTAQVGRVDVVLVAVKAYDNATALPMIPPMVGPATTVLTLQNGVDSPNEVAAQVGEPAVLGGTTYIATALAGPGLIEQTGVHRRIVFGEVFGAPAAHDRAGAGDPRGAARAPTSSRRPSRTAVCRSGRSSSFSRRWRASPGRRGCRSVRSGATRSCARSSSTRAREVDRLARAEGVQVAADRVEQIPAYVEAIPGTMRSSLLIDLGQGRKIEVEALLGSVVRRAGRQGLPAPIISTLYAVLKPYAEGEPRSA